MTALTLYRITAYSMAAAVCMIDTEAYRWAMLCLIVPLLHLSHYEYRRLIHLKIIAQLEGQVCRGLYKIARNYVDVERDEIEQN